MRNITKIGALCVLAGALLCAAPRRARADLFDVYASARAGGMTGWGANKINAQASDFFERVRGLGVGAELGIELFLVNASINFMQLFDKDGAAGTLSQFLVGFDGNLPLDGGRHDGSFLRVGIAGGLAFGTNRPVDPPLDNDQVSRKGPVAQVTLALDKHLSKMFTIGIETTGGYHYFFAGGNAPINEAGNQSQGFHVMALGMLRMHFSSAP